MASDHDEKSYLSARRQEIEGFGKWSFMSDMVAVLSPSSSWTSWDRILGIRKRGIIVPGKIVPHEVYYENKLVS